MDDRLRQLDFRYLKMAGGQECFPTVVRNIVHGDGNQQQIGHRQQCLQVKT